MTAIALAVGAFVLMEPLTALTHRFVMHGIGRRLHNSHHSPTWAHRWEANDAFPVMFAAIVCCAMAIGFNVDGYASLVPVTVGITAYGAAYALVHDAYIHQRIRRSKKRGTPHATGEGTVSRGPRRVLDHLAASHRVHHITGGAPYGMLWPVVPSGSRPSHEPAEA